MWMVGGTRGRGYKQNMAHEHMHVIYMGTIPTIIWDWRTKVLALRYLISVSII
jgi:hypothetical protein